MSVWKFHTWTWKQGSELLSSTELGIQFKWEIHGRLEDEGVMFTIHKNSHFINKMHCQSCDTHYIQDDRIV